MNIPMNYPLFQFLYWLLNTTGIGGLVVIALGGGSLLIYAFLIKWIVGGSQAKEQAVYPYPTPILYHKEEEEQPKQTY